MQKLSLMSCVNDTSTTVGQDGSKNFSASGLSLLRAINYEYPRGACVHHLLEFSAENFAESTAVQFGSRSLTYRELHARANQLARRLQKLGVQKEVVVAIYLERSVEMVVALLGVLKAGGAYLPLDPSHGSARIEYVLEQARVRVLLTGDSLLTSLPRTDAAVICLEPSWSSLSQESESPLTSEVGPKNLAYVIYTSGSTGKPKGVQIEHRSLVNFLYSMREKPGIDKQDALLAVTTLSFDIAGLEIFLPLLWGAKLVVAPREATYDGHLLKKLLAESGATMLQATPTSWRLLFECGWAGDPRLKVLVGGEALATELARRLASSCGPVWNMYGPTETTIWSSLYRVEHAGQRSVSIGTPIANTSMYVLAPDGSPVAVGAEGELYIGGDGLARGYLGRPDLTAERFVPDPFSEVPGARMYRTGDLARLRPDGNLECLGRLDHQVKIRGFRIELGEVETVLEQHSTIQQAVAVARDEASGEKHLVAYFVPKAEAKVNLVELREYLSKQLPPYMIPSALVNLRALPLTPNGKVDRKALPAPQGDDYRNGRAYVAPRDAVEKKLAALWEQVLGVKPIGANDSFFDLGGRSLLAARLFIKIAHEFKKELPLTTLIHAPTLELLANELRPSVKQAKYPTLVAMRSGGSKPPFFCVHGGAGSTLFLHRLADRMGPDQPFYGIEPEGLDGERFHRQTIEQMATHYLSEIRKLQPTGPYYIGGYCLGGIIAFEMAQQLRRQGERIALTALFSAPLRFHRLRPPARPAVRVRKPRSARLATLLKSPMRVLYRKSANLSMKISLRLVPAAARIWLALGFKIPPALRTVYVMRMLLRAEQGYLPQHYPGRLVLFHGADYASDPDLGWDGLADQLEHRIIGDRGQNFRRELMNELVDKTAQELRDSIESALQHGEVAVNAQNQVLT
jgi:amino acid adenylation domain-containing protein